MKRLSVALSLQIHRCSIADQQTMIQGLSASSFLIVPSVIVSANMNLITGHFVHLLNVLCGDRAKQNFLRPDTSMSGKHTQPGASPTGNNGVLESRERPE